MLSVNFFAEKCVFPLAKPLDRRHVFSCQRDERNAGTVIDPHAGLGETMPPSGVTPPTVIDPLVGFTAEQVAMKYMWSRFSETTFSAE